MMRRWTPRARRFLSPAWLGYDNGVSPAMSSEGHAGSFTGRYDRRVIPHVGHNIPQETPREFADAVLSLI